MSKLRVATILYGFVAIAMIATSLYTGHRATVISGRQHYMLTATQISVDEEVPASSAGDAAFDSALREGGESPTMPVDKPLFVLGFADATGPFILAGGGILAILWGVKVRRRRRAAVFPPTPPTV
ncbi:MAG: hypothetical protein HZA51_06450 [Planctomycetes bacterium]|nr:hypothetical protein [Planctomycetota bacterium]